MRTEIKSAFRWVLGFALGALLVSLVQGFLDAYQADKLCRDYCFPFVAVACRLPAEGSTWDVVCATADGNTRRTNAFRGTGMLRWNEEREQRDCQQRCPCKLKQLPEQSSDGAPDGD